MTEAPLFQSLSTPKKSKLWIFIPLFAFALLVITLLFLNPYKILGVQSFKIPSLSMVPTLIKGDHLIVDNTYYAKHPLQRVDVVVFPYPKDPQLTFIKRVIAFEGETLEIKKGEVFINHEKLIEPYLNKEDQIPKELDNFPPVQIPPGKVFVMGDNRGNSSDSREWGVIDQKSIFGKALYIYYSSERNRIGKFIF